MYLKEKTNEAPRIKKVDINFNLRFKPKFGKFEVYGRDVGEKADFKKLEIIPIADSRFTIKLAQNEKGVSVWSGLYKNTNQNITVMRKKGDKIKIYEQGNWEELKAKDFKYVKILHCLVKINNKWERGEFELQGIAAIMWGDIRDKGTDRVITLQISADKDFKTKMGNFYSMIGGATGDIPDEVDKTAKDFASELSEMYASHDKNYKHYNAKNEPTTQAEPRNSSNKRICEICGKEY
jgi:hypothetical protein